MKDKRMKTEEDEDDTPSAPAWMMTYGDMMTLLMIFFILIMSFSTLELDKFKMAMGSLKGALGAFGIQKHLQPTQSFFSPYEINIQKLKANKMLDHIGDLRDLIKKNNLDEYVEIYVLDDSEVYIQIKDHVLFELGKAELKTKYLKILSLIGKTIVKDAKELKVEGHTDNLPIHTNKYPSNWELSLARAMSVVKYFVNIEGIAPSKVSAAGFGEYKPLVPNNSPENRAKNRRVVLHVKW